MSYLWDTNILLHYLNNTTTAKQIQQGYDLSKKEVKLKDFWVQEFS